MRSNSVKEKLRAGAPVIGAFVRFAAPALVEICGHVGFDFVVLDAEHGPLGFESCENLVRAADAVGIPALVRVSHNEPATILRTLDTGALGIHVPNVDCPRAAAEAVRAVKYWPAGTRGLGGVRAAGYGIPAPLSEYVQAANQQTMVVAQVESGAGGEVIEGILATPGLDVVFVGPVDLSQSLGFPGQTTHPEVVNTIGRIRQATLNSSVALGSIVQDGETAHGLIASGYRYLVVGSDGLLARAGRDLLQQARRA